MELPWEWPLRFTLLIAAAALSTTAASLGVLLRAGPIGAARVLQALGVFAALTAAAALVVRQLESSLFGLMSLAYVQAALSWPAIGLVLLVCARGRLGGLARGLAWLSLLAAGLGLWASLAEPRRLELVVQRVPLPAERAGAQPVRVGVLSDLQCTRVGAHEHAAVDLLLAARPDLILLPGDVFQGAAEDWPEVRAGFRDLLRRLVAPAGSYLVSGDCDRIEQLVELVEGTPVRLLQDEGLTLEVHDRRLRLLGKSLRRASRDSPVLRLEDFAAGVNAQEISLVLAHQPRVALDVPLDHTVDLVVCGHTHGGQLRVPGLPPPVDLSPVHNSVGAGGLHRLGVQPVYVSRGVGMERSLAPRVRFACRPEVSLLVLESGAH